MVFFISCHVSAREPVGSRDNIWTRADKGYDMKNYMLWFVYHILQQRNKSTSECIQRLSPLMLSCSILVSMFSSSLPIVVCKISHVIFPLLFFCVFVCVYWCPTHIVFSFVLYTLCCQFLWIVHSWLPLRHSLTFI